ncbi:MAG: pyridoxal phosphate-dependent aminotransferase family protein [Tepidisphaeraceae bacterium]
MLDETPADTADIVVTESIFSMDGDEADLAGIVKLKRQKPFTLVLDEAHATGVLGAGLASELGLTRDVDLGVATFSKALGVIGGAVYGSRAAVDAVVNAGRAYLFSTSMPAGVARAISASIQIARDDVVRRERLARNVELLRSTLKQEGLSIANGRSPIVPIVLSDERAALDASERLRDAGFLVIAVRPPTVPRGTSRLRVTVSSEHTTEQIEALAKFVARASRP